MKKKQAYLNELRGKLRGHTVYQTWPRRELKSITGNLWTLSRVSANSRQQHHRPCSLASVERDHNKNRFIWWHLATRSKVRMAHPSESDVNNL